MTEETPPTINEVELSSRRESYRWYQNYLHPIPTLYNHKLGDRFPGEQSEDALAVKSDELQPQSFAEALLSPEESAAMDRVLAELGETASEEEQAMAIMAHLSLEGAGRLELARSGGYDSNTGIPSLDVPSVSYRFQRVLFTRQNAGVTKRVTNDPPALNTPEDYQRLYDRYLALSDHSYVPGSKVLGFRGFAELYNSDEFFGWQRVAGTNPRALMKLGSDRLSALLAKMPLTDAHVQHVAGSNATVAAEATAGRLYYCDYHLLDGIPIQQGRYLAPAIGVFWADPNAAELRPVAIQLQQTPGRIHTPGQDDWPSARALFQIADFNYHEMGTHLSEGHFAQEAFVIAYRRNLSRDHHLAKLFGEMYDALLFNNALGRIQLVNRGGYTERMMAGELQKGSLAIVRNYYTQVWRWDDWNLDLYLQRQGTDDAVGLPVYPYRDDGLPLWAAIQTFASEYIGAHYSRDAEVANDRELENFVRELTDPSMGNLGSKGFPTSILTKAALAEVLARLIWQAGPGHGGINYSQYQYFAPIANAAGAGYADFTQGTQLPSLMEVLPPITQAIVQADILNVLTQKVFGRLGDYDRSFVRSLDSVGRRAVDNFQNALAACTTQVNRRNDTDARRRRKYPFLDPGNLPNSTNI